MYIPVNLKVIEGLAQTVARGAGINPSTATAEDRVLAGLTRMWHRCWADKTERLTRQQLAGVLGLAQLDELIDQMIAAEFLCALNCACDRCGAAGPADGRYRVGGAHKFVRLRKAFADGGRKGRKPSTLRLNPEGWPKPNPDPEIPISEIPISESSSTPEIPIAEIDTAAAVEYWTGIEANRQAQCERVGVSAKGPCRASPDKQRQLIEDAVGALGLTAADDWRDALDDLLIRFLDDEERGLNNRDGTPRQQPWPIPVFLKLVEQLNREAQDPH